MKEILENSMGIQKVLNEVLTDISPTDSEKEELTLFSNAVLHKLKSISEYPILDIIQVGSTARNANLKNDHDIDIFLRFERNTERETLKEVGLRVGKEVIDYFGGISWLEYAEHPYISGKIGKFSLDIVPCYKIENCEKIISAVDRTPLHNEFLVLASLKTDISNEVRLLKKFLKGLSIYGSDLKTAGFSGYLCELLILKYGSFLNLLNDVKTWKLKKVIVLDEIYEMYGLKNDHKFLEFNDSLIVYDPVDLNRNVAAALSLENYCKFIFYSKMFLMNPNKEFFYNFEKKTINKLNERSHGYFLTIEIKRPENVVEDIVYPQMEKLQKSINKLIKEHDFDYLRYTNFADEKVCYLSWEFLVHELPDVKLRVGPPVSSSFGVLNFIKNNEKYFVSGCNVCAYKNRKYKNVQILFNNIVNGKLKGQITYPKYICPENALINIGTFVERI
ncbi:tRNA cytidylyltransferase [Methanococcus vannielii SB]|uniref:CCA-adding enzyme n=2 Tax=Methanococcus vannielii TaxID=2187 RepID=A6UNS7_METVS|nr:tRNA cytidylyltransferase [Methanococcus vannielii SB]